jgi:hypothetical protein
MKNHPLTSWILFTHALCSYKNFAVKYQQVEPKSHDPVRLRPAAAMAEVGNIGSGKRPSVISRQSDADDLPCAKPERCSPTAG